MLAQGGSCLPERSALSAKNPELPLSNPNGRAAAAFRLPLLGQFHDDRSAVFRTAPALLGAHWRVLRRVSVFRLIFGYNDIGMYAVICWRRRGICAAASGDSGASECAVSVREFQAVGLLPSPSDRHEGPALQGLRPFFRCSTAVRPTCGTNACGGFPFAGLTRVPLHPDIR
jgi:hypothetical protein